ncbi:hypothetical protein ACVL91_005637 [Bradyrhizobium elkanii]
MRGDEVEAVTTRLLIDEIVDVALAIDRDGLGAVAGDCDEAHQLEQGVQLAGIRMGIFDEFEAVGAHRVLSADLGRRRIVRKRTHGGNSLICLGSVSVTCCATCVQNGSLFAILAHDPCMKWTFRACLTSMPST